MSLKEDIEKHNKEIKSKTDFSLRKRPLKEEDLEYLVGKGKARKYHTDGKYTIINGDCLEVMESLIERGVYVDHVITDVPYGTVQGLSIEGWKKKGNVPTWDLALDPMRMYDCLFRISKPNSNILLFCQEPYTFELQYNLSVYQKLKLSNKMIWVKDNHANGFQAKTTPLNYYEEILLLRKDLDETNSLGIRDYFRRILEYIGKSKKEILEETNQGLDHCFRYANRTFYLPTEKNYDLITEKYNLRNMEGYREYKELYEEYSKENDLVFNIPEDRRSVRNVFEFAKDRDNIHPTQKPQGLLRELTRIFSNKGDLVMDFTCGSGSEGMACISEGRRFLGIEKDEGYFEKAWEWYTSRNKPFVFGRNS